MIICPNEIFLKLYRLDFIYGSYVVIMKDIENQIVSYVQLGTYNTYPRGYIERIHSSEYEELFNNCF